VTSVTSFQCLTHRLQRPILVRLGIHKPESIRIHRIITKNTLVSPPLPQLLIPSWVRAAPNITIHQLVPHARQHPMLSLAPVQTSTQTLPRMPSQTLTSVLDQDDPRFAKASSNSSGPTILAGAREMGDAHGGIQEAGQLPRRALPQLLPTLFQHLHPKFRLLDPLPWILGPQIRENNEK
jgi:hypothetical protein